MSAMVPPRVPTHIDKVKQRPVPRQALCEALHPEREDAFQSRGPGTVRVRYVAQRTCEWEPRGPAFGKHAFCPCE